uniref:NADH dehydrogenase [ubiquinone] 1 alpha subcomplex subunit 12 n=1 Tax=Eutreptiella gymnastica TaxID=73025 RepID=A0A7S4FWL1_9EUGL|mmetsp:Transcript_78797/g.131571  ORF Transcript_78797/g.131571 Transcript_78797/m.131571 type:complete len:182 (+) Transcript_78797:38-583(+)|eukprot:CAMPEP_0174366106 /NCGR_PEP_ID=MMETSP0811_2-20130205/79850_1 /TAXON_ID=73025 ORGANISM="Eutreptiella gymnastica-like, Strain CCMP1594" /NCGR_SAMPLE_ID=MMETSP0811_2 /ASSEMBLY_ACC=CAM_ASM_000667 /LENGTH=181 /DNA_ID=CAMNT_0015507337 /DNA_START=38 /DNA_END=583 /DNA_ORIENTATION=+
MSVSKVFQKGLQSAAQRRAGLADVPSLEAMFRPASAQVRQHQWDALTSWEQLKATAEYYIMGKRFVGLDFNGNKYFTLQRGDRIVEYRKDMLPVEVPHSIPIAWQLWLENKNIPHPPHPEEMVKAEEAESGKRHQVHENIQKLGPATAPKVALPVDLDGTYQLEEEAGSIMDLPRKERPKN